MVHQTRRLLCPLRLIRPTTRKADGTPPPLVQVQPPTGAGAHGFHPTRQPAGHTTNHKEVFTMRTVTVAGRKYTIVNVALTIDTDSEFFHLAERYAQRYNTTVEMALRAGVEVGVIPHGEEILRAMLNDPNP